MNIDRPFDGRCRDLKFEITHDAMINRYDWYGRSLHRLVALTDDCGAGDEPQLGVSGVQCAATESGSLTQSKNAGTGAESRPNVVQKLPQCWCSPFNFVHLWIVFRAIAFSYTSGGSR